MCRCTNSPKMFGNESAFIDYIKHLQLSKLEWIIGYILIINIRSFQLLYFPDHKISQWQNDDFITGFHACLCHHQHQQVIGRYDTIKYNARLI